MNKLLKKRMLIISISLAFLLLINIGISYSYYLGKVVGNESSTTVSLTSAGIIINYENNSGVITDNNITPGWSTTKKFSVSSTFNQESTNLSKLWYVVRLCVDDNEFLSDKIVYSLNTDGEITGNGKALDNVENKGIATGTNEEGIVIGSGYFVSGSNTHNYNITFKYADSEIISSNCKFNVHLVVEAALEANVNIDLDGGSISGSSQISSTKYSTITLEEPTKNGYYFNGWEISGNGTIIGNELYINDTNITVKATYRAQSFANDTWEEIATAVRNGNTAGYKVGDTREIAIEGYTNTTEKPTFTLRIANKKITSECDNSTFSQTACGFVIEFVDIIQQRQLNSSGSTSGGWPATILRSYLNGVFLDFLPADLHGLIINTNVISGYNPNANSSNLKSVDRIYLLSTKEIYGTTSNDSLESTRQLDYYSQKGVNYSSYAAVVKKISNTAVDWWLRSPGYSGGADYASYVGSGGNKLGGECYGCGIPTQLKGVSPAFRIG